MGYETTTHTVDVYRLVKVSNKESYDPTPVYTGVDVGIFPAGPDILAVFPGQNAYQAYEGYIYEYVALKNGDKLKVGADEWIIKGMPVVYTMPLSYQRLTLEKVA